MLLVHLCCPSSYCTPVPTSHLNTLPRDQSVVKGVHSEDERYHQYSHSQLKEIIAMSQLRASTNFPLPPLIIIGRWSTNSFSPSTCSYWLGLLAFKLMLCLYKLELQELQLSCTYLLPAVTRIVYSMLIFRHSPAISIPARADLGNNKEGTHALFCIKSHPRVVRLKKSRSNR